MKSHHILFGAVALTSVFTLACIKAEDKAAPAEKKSEGQAVAQPVAQPVEVAQYKEKVSYAIGQNIAGNLLQQGFDAKELDVDVAVLADGFRDALAASKAKYTPEELDAAMAQFQQVMEGKRMAAVAKAQEAAAKNKTDGEAFLADNAKKEGVKTTESGLQYLVLKEGEGDKPKAENTVKVHYAGTLLDGTEFDSSIKRDEPAVFPLNRVIPGWTEAVQLMNVGSKYRLFIPAALAYGEQGRPGIPPNSVLVFEVELLSIEKDEPAAPDAEPVKE